MACLKPIYLSDHQLTVPCGYCHKCRAKRKRDWSFRLEVEAKHSYAQHFITLTYNAENIPYKDLELDEIKTLPDWEKESTICQVDPTTFIPTLFKDDLVKFLKRVRSFQDRTYKRLNKTLPKASFPIRYFAVGEYGSQRGRPHYHALIFNMLPKTVEHIQTLWGKGIVHIGTVTSDSIGYVCKYQLKGKYQKQQLQDGLEKEFQIMSRRPGIGFQFLNGAHLYNVKHDDLLVRNQKGTYQGMPRYFREKVFSNPVKKARAVAKLQKEVLQSGLQEDSRIIALNMDPGLYQYDQLKDFIRRQDKNLKTDRL